MHLISKPSNDNWFLGIGERQIAPPVRQKSQICFVCKSFTSTGFFFCATLCKWNQKKRALFKFQAKWKPKVLKHARFPAKALEQLHSLSSAIVLYPVCFRVVFAFGNSVSFINAVISLHRKALGNLRMDANNSAAWHVSVCVFVHFCLCGCVGVWLGQGVRAGAITWGGCGEHKGGQIQQAQVTRDHRRAAFPHLSVSKHPWKVIETSCPVLQYWYHKTWA